MKQQGNTEKRIEAALESLNDIRRASPQPYFYTRLRARITREEKGWSGIAGLISRPLFALAMICVVLLVNTWIVFRQDNEALPANTNTTSQVATDLPEEYNVAVTTFYDYETPSYE
jgi:hypothetical protein